MQYQTESWSCSYMPSSRGALGGDPLEHIERLASENAVVIFSMSSCCMCHAVKRLFCGMGVNPTVYELDEDPKGKDMEKALMRLLGTSPAVPVVFIGGKLVGSAPWTESWLPISMAPSSRSSKKPAPFGFEFHDQKSIFSSYSPPPKKEKKSLYCYYIKRN
ncbi:hypothetical protein CUMW_249290 [Citrus unshiu]|uniref:Glutaredoxin domain-containing protein n=1 Tax=Citrus unshiu TaxID=55188 RepID=A0A2H5QPE8_CITUN|nr:hypothetical protein CUMW_249290 [Citrus unshiu]